MLAANRPLRTSRLRQGAGLMAPHAIVSYDDTPNDHDALMLGWVAARGRRQADARLRAPRDGDPSLTARRSAECEAEALLERGARWLDDEYVERRVVVSASTGEGLGWLAAQRARRPDRVRLRVPHRRRPRLPVPLGPDPAGARPDGAGHRPRRLCTSAREPEIDTIGIAAAARPTRRRSRPRSRWPSASRRRSSTATAPSTCWSSARGAEAPEGRVMVSSRSQNAIEEATCPVIVAARGAPLYFDTLVTA